MQFYSLSWFYFFLYALLLVGLYFLLVLLSGLVGRAQFLGVWQKRLSRLIRFLLHAYEPVALAILLVCFIFVNPYVHGAIVAFFVILGYLPIRNYINGRIFLLANELKEGQHIEIKNKTGVVKKTERLGLLLQTPEGLRFVNYSSLLSDGFVLLKGEKVGGLYELQLTADNGQEKKHQNFLRNRLYSCPYVDWTFKPEISMLDEELQKYGIRILVREDQHLGHLMRLIKEWGYDCKLAA